MGFIRLPKLTKPDVLYSAAFLLYAFRLLKGTALYSIDIEEPSYFRFIFFAIFMLLLMTVIIYDHKYQNIWLIFILIPIAGITALNSGEMRNLLLVILFIIAAENVNLQEVFRFLAIMMIIYITVIVFLDWLGLFEGYAEQIESVDRNTEEGIVSRAFLGFDYPTKVPNYFYSIVLIVGFCRKDKGLNLFLLAIAFSINYYLYLTTDTRAVYYEVMLYLFVTALLKISKRLFGINIVKCRIIKLLALFSYPIFIGVSFYMGYFYDTSKKWMTHINWILSNRLSLTKAAIDEFGIHMWGSKFEWRLDGYRGTSDYMFVDCSYWNLLLKYGIILFAVIVILFMIIMVDAIRENDDTLVWIMVIVGLHACTDPQLFNIVYTPFILLTFKIIRKWFRHPDILCFQNKKRIAEC
jgi:hypothetical protein